MKYLETSQRIFCILALGVLVSMPLAATGSADTCAAEAFNHPNYGRHGDGHAFWLPGIGTDFIFTSGPGDFVENADGTARLTGTVRSALRPDDGFTVDVTLTGRQETPPAGSPKKELKSSAYADNGGPVDPSTWHYYTGLSGTLNGIGEYAGAEVTITRTGPSVQVGEGANGKNELNGLATWFDWTVNTQPSNGLSLQVQGTGDINIDLVGCDSICVEEAVSDSTYHNGNSNHSLWLPGIGKDFIFDGDAGEMIFLDNGTAYFRGIVHRISNPNQGFEIDVRLDGLSGPFPPGSPKKELKGSSYSNNGGRIDPNTWIFYTDLEGTLRGTGELAGAVVSITHTGPALQLGDGANGKNANFGAASWLNWLVLTDPTSGPALKMTGKGDFNLDLVECDDTKGGGGGDACAGAILYGVHDADLDDSQLFKMNLRTGDVEALGPVRPGLDLESLAIDPATGDLFTTAARLGDFYQVDKDTGDLTLLGNTGSRKFREISAMAYHPDGTLWGFQKVIGLVTIDPTTGDVNQEWRADSSLPIRWDAIAWNGDGTVLYGSERSTLLRFNPATRTAEQVCGPGFLPDKTEALDFDINGRLVGGWHDADSEELSIFEIDTVNCSIFSTNFITPYNDIESLAFEICEDDEPQPVPGRLGDRVWFDRNGDGVQDPDEPGLAGVTVEVVDSSGTVVAVKVTDSEGRYEVNDLPPGDYRVDVGPSTLPPGMTQTFDYDGLASANSAQATLAAGQSLMDLDFGYEIPAAVCTESTVYGVHDAAFDDSQLFKIDLDTNMVTALGPVNNGLDLESLDLNPLTGRLYTTAARLGNFYEVDKATGTLIPIGNTGSRKFREISAMSFDPSGQLWGFMKDIGLLHINLLDGSTSVAWGMPRDLPVTRKWDGLAWNPTGTALWGAERDRLYKWDPASRTVEQVCGDGFLPDKTEALDFDLNGNLIAGWHEPDSPGMSLFEVDVANCSLSESPLVTTFSDIESLAFEVCEPPQLGSIGDLVWNDENGNDAFDLGEATFPGVVVELYDGEGVLVATTMTDSFGEYHFPNLPADTYTVRVDPSGLPSEDLVPSFDLDGIGSANEAVVTLANGEDRTDVDFAYRADCSGTTIYGIHDDGLNDSQLFKLDIATRAVEPLGPIRLGFDLESLDLHPVTGDLYTTASVAGDFYQVDKETGDLTLIGNTGARKFREIAALSFHPDGTLWGFQKNIGLVTIDLATGLTTRQVRIADPLPKRWDAFAWAPDGSVGYGSERDQLIRYDPATQTAEVICGAGFLPDKTEALDFGPDGSLLGGWHNESADSLQLFRINPDLCETFGTDIDTTYNDIESLAFEVCN